MNQVTIQSHMVGSNPHMSDMPDGSAHYQVRLNYQRRQMTLHFSHGPAICADPTAEGVLECLLSDLSGADENFQDWADGLGYDTDSRKAEKTYNVVKAQAVKTRNLLGDALQEFYDAPDQERFLRKLCKR
jgi:hypothetical protein